MTQLTKAERKKFYKKLMKIVCADSCVYHGFCYYIDAAAIQTSKEIEDLYGEYTFDCDFIQDQLPELFRIKPKSKPEAWSYWFAQTNQGWQTRINKLYNIIQSM